MSERTGAAAFRDRVAANSANNAKPAVGVKYVQIESKPPPVPAKPKAELHAKKGGRDGFDDKPITPLAAVGLSIAAIPMAVANNVAAVASVLGGPTPGDGKDHAIPLGVRG